MRMRKYNVDNRAIWTATVVGAFEDRNTMLLDRYTCRIGFHPSFNNLTSIFHRKWNIFFTFFPIVRPKPFLYKKR